MFQIHPEADPLSSGGEVRASISAVWRPDRKRSPGAQPADRRFEKAGWGDKVLHQIVEHDHIDRSGLR